MAGPGGPLRTRPTNPWEALLASLPATGASMPPQLPVAGAMPASVDPQRASVLDAPTTALMRQVAQALNSGELASSAMSASPAVAMVSREAQADLIARLMQSWAKGGQQMPGPVQEAITLLAQRFPRALSHVQAVEPYIGSRAAVRGQFRPMPSEWNGRAGVIEINPNQPAEGILQTLTHELTHAGQQLRAVSRGSDLDTLYSAFPEQYFTNPFEVRARTAQLNQAYRRAPGAFESPAARLREASELALNPFQFAK